MNKPVAWMLKTGHGTKILEVKPYCEVDYWIPLYTNPVKVNYEFNSRQLKQLTDEEIISSAEEAGFDWSSDKGIFARHSNGSWIGLDVKMVDFAKAILRKAQEK